MHATVSLTMTLPKKGIRVPPELYHQILYAHSTAKHGRTNMNKIFSELCILRRSYHYLKVDQYSILSTHINNTLSVSKCLKESEYNSSNNIFRCIYQDFQEFILSCAYIVLRMKFFQLRVTIFTRLSSTPSIPIYMTLFDLIRCLRNVWPKNRP